MRKKIKIIIFMIVILILIAAGIFVVSSLEGVRVKGNTYYTENKLKNELQKYYVGGNTILTYLRLKYDKSITIPFVDEIETDFTDLHSLTVAIIEKEVVGCLPYMGEFICFDKDGIMVGSITGKKENGPVVNGIDYNAAVFNKPISTKNDEVFELILNLTQVITKYKLEKDKLLKHDSGMLLSGDHLWLLLLGSGVAFVVALLAIRFFIAYVSKYGFKAFGWYRIVAGSVILLLMACGVELNMAG